MVEIKIRDKQSQAEKTPVETSPQVVEALIRVARDRYAKGEFESAASAYEKAIKAGASKGSSNQRLAQCYEKLGRKDEAVSAYKKAMSAFEAQQAKNPEARIERAIAACHKAMALLEQGDQ